MTPSRAPTPSSLIPALRDVLGDTYVYTTPADMAPYLTDWRKRYTGQAQAVVFPANTEEVAAVLRVCAQFGVPVVPQGGNTGLVGGATPDITGQAVLIKLNRLNKIRTLDLANHTMTVEAGCILADVQQAAAARGLLFPLSLASEGSCTLGGNLSSNAGGVQVLRYGNTRELTLGLEVVLADGQVWDGLRGLRKDNTGYDLKHLFIGAEGTLGIITAAVLKLYAAPKSAATAWVALPTVEAAVALLHTLRARFDARLTAFELMSERCLNLVVAGIPGCRAPFEPTPPWMVLVALSDPDEAAALDAALQTALLAAAVPDAVVAQNQRQAHEFWALREQISAAQSVEGPSIKHDISLPVSAIPAFLSACNAALLARFPTLRFATFGHLGDGNLHYNVNYSRPDNRDLFDDEPTINEIVYQYVMQHNGSISAEHGLGQLKRTTIAQYRSPLERNLMKSIKAALDPDNRMNPGKVI